MNPAELTEFNCVPNLIETEFNRESTAVLNILIIKKNPKTQD